ncbi:MAG TPA: GrpB family protein [Gaiellaceae bacterium]|nr:GrpB family protein [Gaiellaceae bacterium]
MTKLDELLVARLAEVGLDPDAFGDPAEAFARLHARFGQRVTLVDRYALEAAARGVEPEKLDHQLRARLAREVIPMQLPGWEVVEAGARTVADPIEVVVYRKEWAERFAAWHTCLVEALGTRAVRVEHVGSTAVPGLAAKPVVDILVGVRDVEDEGSYVPATEGLGVALRSRDPGHRYFRPAGDLPRTVHIHVVEAGGDWERGHLLFRDFLRADEPTRRRYASLKRELAARYRDDRLAYNEGKTGFILDALQQAETWAERTGWTFESS